MCWAHNPEVNGSKSLPANFSLLSMGITRSSVLIVLSRVVQFFFVVHGYIDQVQRVKYVQCPVCTKQDSAVEVCWAHNPSMNQSHFLLSFIAHRHFY